LSGDSNFSQSFFVDENEVFLINKEIFYSVDFREDFDKKEFVKNRGRDVWIGNLNFSLELFKE